MMRKNKIVEWITGHQWPTFIIAVLVVSVALTGVSLWLYQAGDAIRLDMSRPGYEKARESIQDDGDTTESFSPTGNLDDQALADFRSRYETIKNRLDQTDNYDCSVTTDENLGLSPGQAVTEPIQ